MELATKDVTLPDGSTVRVREINALELETLMAGSRDAEGKPRQDFNRRLVQLGALNGDGHRRYADGDEALAEIGQLPGRAVLRMARAISELSGLNESLEDGAKN